MEKSKKLSPLTKKVLIILGLAIGLNFPLAQVEDQVTSRHAYESVAQKEVAQSWGESVVFKSPIIYNSAQNVDPVMSQVTFEIESQEKKRGWFRVPVYTVTYKAKVQFQKPQKFSNTPEAFFLSVLPTKSLQSLKIKDVQSGKDLKGERTRDGIRLSAEQMPEKTFFNRDLEIEISLRGTGAVFYDSSADHDQIRMVGNWPKPKFDERLLPEKSTVSDAGFEASWVLRALPDSDDGSLMVKTVGMDHLWVDSSYVKVERAVKYGILFVALTFILVFLIELKSHIRVHPFQYGLIGLALSVFYLLLLAITETIGFDLAYLVSSIAVTALIVVYVQGFLPNKKFVSLVLAEQVFLSSFFYILLSLENVAFLIGSIGVFLVLATFMMMTRRTDWYTHLEKQQLPE